MLGIRLQVWLVVALLLAGSWRVYASKGMADALLTESERVGRAARSEPRPQTAAPLPAATAHKPSAPAVPAPDAAGHAPPVRPEPGSPSGTRVEARPLPSGPSRVDTQLVILEDEAARAALRRGLGIAGAAGKAERVRLPDASTNETAAQDGDAERHALSDELLVDHLAAEAYRTTVFSRDQDGVGETRAAALSMIRSLTPEDRQALLLSALADTDARPPPVFEAAPRVSTVPTP